MPLTIRRFGMPGIVLAITGLTGCSSMDAAPSAAMEQAELIIRQAEQSGAAEHSPRELDLARENLDQAREAVAEEEYADARRLAEKSAADAELAAAQARSEEAELSADELYATIATLRSEASRGNQ